MKNSIKKHLQDERGITVFIAMVITAALLVVSAGIVTLSVREARISNASRESQFAFYAADSGIECALYWDQKYNGNSTAFKSGGPASLTCAGQNASITGSTPYTFTISNLQGGSYCATVTVDKTSGTKIESRGRNTCDTSNTRRVERALRVTY